MQQTKNANSGLKLYKIFVYVALITLAVVILIPVLWVFLASVKQNREFYGNPWTLPAGFYFQNFIDAWSKARLGEFMLNSVLPTVMALVILLVVALPAAYCLSRFHFRGRRLLNTCFMAGLFINVNYIVVLALVYASTALPFTIYLLSGYFATLPHDFEEAAYIDGAD